MRQLLNSFFDLVRIQIENNLVLQGLGCCVHKNADCQYHMALQWLPITGFGVIKDDIRIPHSTVHMKASQSQNLLHVTVT